MPAAPLVRLPSGRTTTRRATSATVRPPEPKIVTCRWSAVAEGPEHDERSRQMSAMPGSMRVRIGGAAVIVSEPLRSMTIPVASRKGVGSIHPIEGTRP